MNGRVTRRRSRRRTSATGRTSLTRRSIQARRVRRRRRRHRSSKSSTDLHPIVCAHRISRHLVPNGRRRFTCQDGLISNLTTYGLRVRISILVSEQRRANAFVIRRHLNSVIYAVMNVTRVMMGLNENAVLRRLFMITSDLLMITLLMFHVNVILNSYQCQEDTRTRRHRRRPCRKVSNEVLLNILTDHVSYVFCFRGHYRYQFRNAIRVTNEVT